MLGDLDSRGRLIQAGTAKLSMQFTDPKGDALVMDGQSLWVYTPSTAPGQVIRMPLPSGPTFGPNVLAWLLDDPVHRYRISYTGAETVNGTPADVIALAPLDPSLPFVKATLWIGRDDGLPQRVQVKEKSGTRRTLSFSRCGPTPRSPRRPFASPYLPGCASWIGSAVVGPVTLRRARADDVAALTELSRRTFIDTYAPHNRPENLELYLRQSLTVGQWRVELSTPGSVVLLAETDTAGARPGTRRSARTSCPDCVRTQVPVELARLYVAREFQGSGIGGVPSWPVHSTRRDCGEGPGSGSVSGRRTSGHSPSIAAGSSTRWGRSSFRWVRTCRRTG